MVYRGQQGTGESWYDTAQICLSGHVINSTTRKNPDFNKKFCNRCGQPTITECQKCGNPIQGEYHVEGVGGISLHFPAPAFCQNCGGPFPWTDSKVAAARELALELDNLNETEKLALSKSLDDLVRDTPSTPVSANRFKRLMMKVGKESAGAMKDILVDVISEAAKKIIWPT